MLRVMMIDAMWMLAALAVLGSCAWKQQRCQGWARHLLTVAVVALALVLGLHLWPGFPRWPLWSGEVVKACSIPAWWVLHLDKAAAGYVIWLCLRRTHAPASVTWPVRLGLLGGGAALVLLLALASGFVHWQPALPPLWPWWLLANIGLTVVAEEVLFRGLLHGEIQRGLAGRRHAAAIAVTVTAILFALVHAGGGPLYMVLALVAGLFYGLMRVAGGHLGWAIAAHAAVNAAHFLLFSWPAAATGSCPPL